MGYTEKELRKRWLLVNRGHEASSFLGKAGGKKRVVLLQKRGRKALEFLEVLITLQAVSCSSDGRFNQF